MKFYENMKILHKMVLIAVVLVVGFIVIGLVYNSGRNIQKTAKLEDKRVTAMDALTLELGIESLAARRNEKDFLMRKDKKYLDKQAKTIAAIYEKTGKLDTLSKEPQIKAIVAKLNNAVKSYETSFNNVVVLEEELGLEYKSGEQGKLRDIAHKVEAIFKDHKGETALYNSLLMMRRHEKDFLLRGDDKYVKKMGAELAVFKDIVDNSKLSDEAKQIFKDGIDKYTAIFQSMVAASKKVVAETEIFRASAHSIAPLLDELMEKVDALSSANDKYQVKALAAVTRSFVTTLIIVTVIIALLLFGITKGIMTNITNLLDESKRLTDAVESGELSVRADVDKINFEFQGIVKGMNETVEAFVKPINVTSDYVSQIGNGIIPPKISEEYKGDFNEIKDSLNSCIDAMTGLLEETTSLILAGQEGKLDARGNAAAFKGSWGEMIRGINTMLDAILEPISEAKGVLEEMAKGDLTKKVTGNYKGDHALIKVAISSSLDSLNDTLGQVSSASDQITYGSQQVSDSSQSLSQGATEQASSLEQITSAMTQIGSQTKQNAENATQANQLASQASEVADTGNAQMKQMISAMEEINASSKNISKIIKVIDEIAFQTNLLALNAAVEAARAGKHGKGFAVVAEEVRNLAARSAKAAKETAELIEGSVKKVDSGSEIVTKTAGALEEIVDSVTKVSDLVAEIAAASTEQSQGITQINQGLGQIEQVTQQNTANAEESASAAIQLSGQATQMQTMLNAFKLTAQKAIETHAMEQRQVAVGGSGGSGGRHLAAISHDEPHGTTAGAAPVKPSDVIALDDKEFGRY